jgi:hypothetical protein
MDIYIYIYIYIYIWKEKFFTGLPILLGEKVWNKIKDTFTSKTISYD